MLNISTFTKTCKKYAKDKKISDEQMLNTIVEIITLALNKSEEIHIDKNRVSEIMNKKYDIPKYIKNYLSDSSINELLYDNIQSFLDESILNNSVDSLIAEFTDLLKTDSSIDFKTVERILSLCDDNNAFLLEIFKISVLADNKSSSDSIILWENGVNSVNVMSGDIFTFPFGNRKKYTCITVIPVNTSFDTHISRKYENESFPLVSEKTLHGQWLQRIVKSGTDEDKIYEKIVTGLKVRKIQPIGRSLSDNAKTDCYPIGTVAVYEHNGNFFYLAAASGFNENNNAHSTAESIEKTLYSALNEYNESGQGYDMYIPLIGTGRSRAGLSNQESFDLIIKCLKNNTNLIQGKLTMVIRPEDIKKIKMGW